MFQDIFFCLADQIEKSHGPKMVRGPVFGNHCPRGTSLPGWKPPDIENTCNLIGRVFNLDG